MDEQPNGGSDNGPPIVTNLKGWIAGLTGLVVAVAGLLGAYKQLFPEKKADAAASVAAPADGARPVAAASIPATPGDDPPLLYEGDDAKLEFVDDQWVLTTSEGRYEYKEMYSPDEGRVLAFDKVNNAYLRWPIKGGMSEESTDGEDTWKRWVKLYPAEPAEDGDATE